MHIIFDGPKALAAYENLLRNAKRSIWISMYMLRFDPISNRLWDIIEQRWNDGVEVQIWYDLLGSLRSVPKLSITPYCHPYIPKLHRLNNRNHTKIILVDDKIGVVSGRNFTRKYFEDWVDTSIIIDKKDQLRELIEFKQVVMGGKVRFPESSKFRVTDPLTRDRSIYNFVLEHIVKSKKEITILSPYFAIDDAMENLLLAAADRGVKITIIIPNKPEHRLAITLNRVNFQRVHHPNVHVMESNGMFHSKVMLFDDVALVGTANFDNRSFKKNLELSIVFDKRHIRSLKNHIGLVAHRSVKYSWIQRAYDRLLLSLYRPIMDQM